MMTMTMSMAIGMRSQRRHHSNDDGDCDSNSANDADIDDDIDDGGKQQRKQMQQQHSSAAINTRLDNPLLFRVKASVKKRSPPSCGLRPECSDLQQTCLTLAQTSGNSGKCASAGKS